ncbi:VanZ family protein [Chryseobacterium sp. MP_3.2]|nr:VanZ family protein [Chryseobacterium sp. MP_3.2]
MMRMFQNYYLQSNTKNPLDKISKIFKKILPIYWAFLTYMLLRPGVENVEFPFMFSGIDKVLHISIFAWLAFCFVAAYPKVKFLTFIYIMLIYSLITELLQDIMGLGRSLETLDLVADTVGILIGYLIFKRLARTQM